MRCLLIVFAGLLLCPLPADAEGSQVSSKIGVYQDDDKTVVVTSLVDGDIAIGDSVSLGAHLLVDSVSSASVDVVSAASESFTETRLESGGRIAIRDLASTDLGLSLAHSKEADWESYAVQVTAARDFANRNTRLSAGWGHVANQVGRASDPNFRKSLSSDTFELGATQLLTPKTYVSARYTYQQSQGWHASPYRYVSVMSVRAPEVLPQTRSRHALTVQSVRSLSSATALDLSYRFYRDSWGLQSHTLGGVFRYAPGEHWDLRLRTRYYTQGAVHFFRRRYMTTMKYMSSDRELTSFWNVSAGLRLARGIGAWKVDAKIDAIHYEFLEFEPLASRLALVSSLGVRYAW